MIQHGLFTPLTIRGLNFKNRIVVSPMCQYSSDNGFANDWHLVHLGSRAVGGAALVIVEATAVSAEGRITPKDLGIYEFDHMSFLKRITDFIHAQGSVAGIQLAHAGRKASKTEPWNGNKSISIDEGGWQTFAPSAIPFTEGDPLPREMTLVDIKQCIQDFRVGAARAVKAGFKVIELHAAHGYLINQFLSPLTNHRKDEYGGSFEKRTKLLIQICTEVREVLPDEVPLFVRISAQDWVEGGWTLNDSVKLVSLLKEVGVDLIDCSSGGVVKEQKIIAGPGFQVPFAEEIKKKTGILTGAVGQITEAEQANEIILKNKADLVLLAREFLRDPYFPLRAARELGVAIPWPVQYERANGKKH
jgi:2,4-dienoyl-CoA reductase-like NADH-dependent reductase (Old Yellow Enzyme family)